jgi:hypothetical protein
MSGTGRIFKRYSLRAFPSSTVPHQSLPYIALQYQWSRLSLNKATQPSFAHKHRDPRQGLTRTYHVHHQKTRRVKIRAHHVAGLNEDQPAQAHLPTKSPLASPSTDPHLPRHRLPSPTPYPYHPTPLHRKDQGRVAPASTRLPLSGSTTSTPRPTCSRTRRIRSLALGAVAISVSTTAVQPGTIWVSFPSTWIRCSARPLGMR